MQWFTTALNIKGAYCPHKLWTLNGNSVLQDSQFPEKLLQIYLK